MAYRAPNKIDDRKIRFAIVGCGRISSRHVDALKDHHKSADLIAVCDNNPEVLLAETQRLDVPGFASIEELMEGSEADVIVLCTPSGLHPTHTLEVARHGRHIITEKPMATRLADGKRMVASCDAEGVQLFVVKQNRLNPTLQLLKRAIKKRLRPYLHGQRKCFLDAPAAVLRFVPVAGYLGVRWWCLDESSKPLH